MVDYMEVSPKQVISIGTGMIPFLEKMCIRDSLKSVTIASTMGPGIKLNTTDVYKRQSSCKTGFNNTAYKI